jgi:hypothetical protein
MLLVHCRLGRGTTPTAAETSMDIGVNLARLTTLCFRSIELLA